VMAKLFERGRTGRGGLVSTSLLRCGIYSIAWDIGIQLRFGRRESTKPRDRIRSPLINSYRAGDGRVFWLICLEADRHWPKVLDAIERPELAADPRFVDARTRLEHSEAVVAELDAAFATRPLDEWAERFDDHDVWWAPVLSIVEVIDDPQAAAAFVETVPRPGEEPYRAVNTPVDFDGHEPSFGPVPLLGEHTEAVRADLRDSGR
jgi:crotonobetainyl-CoA:carnitine CoA-transferase CaiB-like acyl-CoA transferase